MAEMIEDVRYTASGSILALIGGVEMTVPDDPSNRHRKLLADWEAAGNVIAPYKAPPEQIPAQISARQLRLALLSAGLLDQVEPAIATLPPPDRAVAEVEWEYATTFERTHPTVALLAAALGMGAAEIDATFIKASNL